jgi:hypothetical protein
MFETNQISDLKTKIDQSHAFIIALPPEPDLDTVAAGLSLYFSLSQKHSVKIGCSSPIKITSARLFGIDKILTSVGNQNLLISFNYPEDKLDKIDYEKTEDGKVNLLIKPRTGESAPDPKEVSFNYTGVQADLIFVIGIQSLEELGRLYSDEKEFFDSTPIVSLNLTNNSSSFAKHSFHTATATSNSEITAYLIQKLNLSLTPDSASNLLLAIADTTQNYTHVKTSSNTFELTAFLLRQGGRRLPNLSQQPILAASPTPSLTPVSAPASVTNTNNQPIPSDWKKPKIFHSNTQGTK